MAIFIYDGIITPKNNSKEAFRDAIQRVLFFTALGHSVNVREEPALSTGYLDLPQIQRKTLLQV